MTGFLCALRAWAQREWARRHPTRPEDVRRLLRDRLTRRIGPGSDGAPRPGDLRAFLAAALAEWPSLYAALGMDVGWSAKIADGAPWAVFTSSALRSYLGGSGSSLPGSLGRVERLVGLMGMHSTEACYAGRPAPAWTGALPDRGESGEYQAQAWPSGTPIDPRLCTGLAKLWAQCGGKPPVEWAGTSPGQIAVVRSPLDQGPAWWLLTVGSSGIYATRLIVPEKWQCLVEWLADGSMGSVADAMRIEAWILRVAQPERDEAKALVFSQIASSAEMGAVYSGCVPVLTWDWKDQTLGSAWQDQAAAVCVMWDGGQGFGSTWGITSHEADIAVTFADGIPTATATAGTATKWSPGDTNCRIGFAYGESDEWGRIHPPLGQSPYGNGAPVFGFHRYGHERTVGTFAYSATAVAVNKTVNWAALDYTCTTGTKSGTSESGSAQRIGWVIPGGDPDVVVSSTKITNAYTLAGGAAYETNKAWTPTTGPGGPGWYAIFYACDGTIFLGPRTYDADHPLPNPMTRTPVGVGTQVVHTEEKIIGGSGANTLLIGPWPRTYVIVCSRAWTANTGSYQRVNRLTADKPQQAEWSTFNVVQDTLAGITAKYNTSVSQMLSGGPNEVIDTSIVGPKSSCSASLMDASGDLHTSSDPALWGFASASDTPQILAWSVGSYGGEALVGLPDGREFPAGLDDLAVQGRPVGWQ